MKEIGFFEELPTNLTYEKEEVKEMLEKAKEKYLKNKKQ